METNRSVLEVLKFLDAKDILLHTSHTSQHWSHLSNSLEIWHFFCESLNISPSDILSFQSNPKLAYRELAYKPIFNLAIRKDEGQISLYDCTKERTIVTINCGIGSTGSAVMITDTQLIFTGGGKSHKKTCLVTFQPEGVIDYPEMLDARRYHGSAFVCRTVYVFGGDIEKCHSAEKFPLSSKAWTWLPEMSVQRSAFTPCVHKLSIYLCGGNVPECHLFDCRREVYTQLPLSLPSNTWCVASYVEGELIVECGENRIVWREGELASIFKAARCLIP